MRIGDDEFAVVSLPTRGDAAGGLTRAERNVADMLVEGLSNAHIARRRGSSVNTVANQVASIFRKLGVSSRAELVARWLSPP